MNEYTFRLVGSKGCEIVGPDGNVIAWTVSEITATIIVALLNQAEREGLGAMLSA